MALGHCIIAKAERGVVNPKKVKELEAYIQKLQANPATGVAELQANLQALETLKHRLAKKKQRTALQIMAVDRADQRMANATGRPSRGVMSLLTRDLTDKNPGINVETLHKDILGDAHAIFADGLERFRIKGGGFIQDKAGLRALVRELYGEATGDVSANHIAKAWDETTEYLRKRYNAAGGDIAGRKDWRLPQGFFDMRRVRKVIPQQFLEDMKRANDLSKIIDADTAAPITMKRFEEEVLKIYDRIRTDGMIDLKPGEVKSSLFANRHNESRFFSYKDADAWMEMQEKYGDGNVFDILVGHMDRMARDISILEVLGPNPDTTMRYLYDKVKKTNVETGGQEGDGVDAIEDVWGILTGRLNSPVNSRVGEAWASFNQGMRNILTSAQLGSAFISAISSDIGTHRLTAKFNGLSDVRLIYRIAKNFASSSSKKEAVRLGLVAEHWSSAAIAQQRYLGEVMGPAVTRRVADTIMRVTGLSPFTQAGKLAFGEEFLATLADNAGKQFDQLSKPLQNSLERYAITPAEWDIARGLPLHNIKGAEFMRPMDIAKAGHVELAAKLKQMVLTETEFAVPSTTARVRAQLTGGLRAGTFWGEVVRDIALYKSFPLTMMHTHGMRVFAQESGWDKGKYLAQLMITTTLFGMLGVQAKQIINGKDPINPDDPEKFPKLLGASMMQGGGLGLFGDFLFADMNSYGHGPVMTAAGPVAGFVGDTLLLTLGNIQQGVKGDDTNVGRELVKYAKRYTPGSSVWYGRLALERMVWDQLQLMADPEAYRSFNMRESKLREDYDQQFYWRPGEMAPERGPGLGD